MVSEFLLLKGRVIEEPEICFCELLVSLREYQLRKIIEVEDI